MDAGFSTIYRPENGRIKGQNLPRYSNRYIYEANKSNYIMAGDRPHMRLAQERNLLGTLRLFAGEKPLDECENVDFSYYPGRVDWVVKDSAFEGEIRLTVTAPGDGVGIALRAESPIPLRFTYRGLSPKKTDPGHEAHPYWNFSILVADKSLQTTQFDEAWLIGNETGEEEGVLYIESPAVNENLKERCRIFVKCDGTCTFGEGGITGTFAEYFLAQKEHASGNPRELFEQGLARSERIASSLTVETPDEYINACSLAAAAEMDGAWHPPKTMHGNMSWNMPFVGWLSHQQHTLGFHDRALDTLKAYADAQVKSDEKRAYTRSPNGTMPEFDSRYYGQGHIAEDQAFYNMQTQFFHQMIRAWRYSGNPEFAAILRDALRLHLIREDECFDPEGTGLYESVINTWPTDSVFNSGGGSVEETCYVYAAVCAMIELCEGEEKEKYRRKAEKIKKAFFDQLWIEDRGYPGAWVDRIGLKRLHKDAWLYSAFMPIECGLVDEFQAAQALYYPYWALEQDKNGLFWFSNWTPGIWSVRECSSGENMQYALAALRCGKVDAGVNVISGFARSSLDAVIPGNLTDPVIESATQFACAVVEGLFGYEPDYPNGRVTVAPKIPFAWGHARMKTGNIELVYDENSLRVTLAKPAKITLQMRLYAEELLSVRGTNNWRLVPSMGGMIVEADFDEGTEACLQLETRGRRDFEHPIRTNAIPEGEIFNPQNVTPDSHGAHLVFKKSEAGYWQEYWLDMGKDPVREEIIQKQRTPIPENATFVPIDISKALNANVEGIFREKYLTPRYNQGTSLQIAYDGFNLWTFSFWGTEAPPVTLEKKGIVTSEAGIPFAVCEGEKNIAFTSIWDNFPTSVTIPVNDEADMAIVAVTGSTNPMQCGIENAQLTFVYADDTFEELPLVNPQNYISLCAYPRRATATHYATNRSDVFNPIDECLLRDFTPEVVPLGENVRTLLIRWPLKKAALKEIRLETLSIEVVTGIMAVTLVK